MTAEAANMIPDITFLDDWPRIQSQVAQNPEAEDFIADIVSRMTLEEKVGQMIQPDLREVTPDEVMEYKLGSILNGGGAFPDNNKYATAAPLKDLEEQGMDLATVTTPFLIYSDTVLTIRIGRVRLVP